MHWSERTIVVVDDERLAGSALRITLEQFGFKNVRTFIFAEDALEELDSIPTDAIWLIDMQLNGIQGNELIEQLNGRGVCILVSADIQNKRYADDFGINFIQKPIMPEELQGVFKQCFSQAN
jgi:FixJ family two-component response regulator